ncbi:MAG: class I SAM-dependent methyltransferase [Actinomycetota bacterium]
MATDEPDTEQVNQDPGRSMSDVVAATVAQTDALVERIFGASIGTLELAAIHVGDRLGFYRSLGTGSATPTELAERTGTAPRYVREWLEQQAVSGFLAVDDPSAGPEDRRYALPEAYRPVFVDSDDLNHLAPLAQLTVGVLAPIDRLLDAYRTGAGVSYETYGEATREGISRLNRPMFLNQLAGWLAAIPEVDARLRAETPARVADLACGTGWSSIAIARAYPGVLVDGLDLDTASIEMARGNVSAAGLADQVSMRVQDASDPQLTHRYDLVTIFEALHDMDHPVQALASARGLLANGGCVVLGDERVADRFTAPGDEIERFNYGWSVLHCLAVGMTTPGSAGTGTVMRPDTVRTYASEAGFAHIEVLSVEHDFWRFYRLVP